MLLFWTYFEYFYVPYQQRGLFFFFFLGAVWYLFNDIENSVHFVPKFEAAEAWEGQGRCSIVKIAVSTYKILSFGKKIVVTK